MTLQKHTEGKAKLLVPIEEVVSRDLPVFFNQKMELNRTISVAVLQALEKDQLQIALPLAGSGVRAVRFLKELAHEKITRLVCNDMDSEALKVIKENIRINNLEKDMRLELSNKEANEFLELSTGFDYIDIDPFGSPNFLLDVASRRISREGILAVTATDTGALAGSFIGAGKMKYWATNTNNTQKHEIGLRILARKVMLVAMQHAKALTPILSYHKEHYYRIFFKVQKGKKAAAKAYDKTTYSFAHCPNCGFIGKETKPVCPECSGELEITGPCYSGPLQDKTRIKKIIANQPELEPFFTKRLTDDATNSVGFYDTHELAKKHNKQPIKIQTLIERLTAKNFVAVQSCFETIGIKTNAPLKEIISCFN